MPGRASQVAEAYGCTPLEGVLSHQMKKHVIDANKMIVNKVNEENKPKEVTIEKGDVFSMDIAMSTGEGKPKVGEKRCTVFKRDLEEKYSLKMKASRAFFSEARRPTLPGPLLARRRWPPRPTERRGAPLPGERALPDAALHAARGRRAGVADGRGRVRQA